MRIDLHAHSNASDGTDSPADVIASAAHAGLDVVALTDHDTVSGHAAAAAALHRLPPGSLTLVPGAELSCRVEGISMHMLAYLFDAEEPEFSRERERIRTDRFRRGEAVVERCRALGAPISWEQVRRIAGDGAVGRPHIASALVEAGVVPTVGDAFTAEWLANGGRADVRKQELDPAEAVRLVRAAGGVAVFAHPGAVKRGRTVPDRVIADLAAVGLAGLEVDHSDHDEHTRARLRGLAADLGLLTTGSSDYHGSRKAVRLGDFTTDPAVYEELIARATGAKPITA